ncbi:MULTISPECIES: class I SAM-dependent methyltransferase [unclassified Leptolyngbya]|uniref:class I SAM-dependent methyltransferase n=1 Tax=unclassified Leptolyngbya TaxID=2650499 RepID=UPI0016853019|nr:MULTISPECIES: class I SAM-dependent methyltransferase [unclassified Leptolyngbya]MBD1911866.1 class I SAM-dependent methyltransferase [Leptolyngbya sp. FACHB-8]MBD2156075.1 class I SAM-dependent methyltransferase [Leptolyngbya sp. FACHB-16]
MANKSLGLSSELHEYLLSVSLKEADVLQQLRQETAQHPQQMMQVTPDEGQFLGFLVRLLGVRKALEIGVFTGYSSLSVALALPDDGQLIACDVSEEFTAIARRYWEKANVSHKIDLRIAPALDTLDTLLAEGAAGTFDFVFIDADKLNYWNYFERSIQLVRSGGVIAVDNVLWSGQVIEPSNHEPSTEAIRTFNQKLYQDNRVTVCMLPVSDGITLAMKH